MFTAFILVALIIVGGIIVNYIDSAYEDYKEYTESENERHC